VSINHGCLCTAHFMLALWLWFGWTYNTFY